MPLLRTVATNCFTMRSWNHFNVICNREILAMFGSTRHTLSQCMTDSNFATRCGVRLTVRTVSAICNDTLKPKLLQLHTPLSLNCPPFHSPPPLLYPQQQSRTMANVAKQSKKEDATSEPTLSYWEQKKAAKDRRRELFISRQERKQRVKVRRAGKPQDTKKIEFQTFFIEKKVTDEHLDRKSRQAGLEWKVRVAVLLERLNVVLPDKEPWEVEYENLKTHLNRFGKQYPKEFSGNFDYDQERPMTYDELLAQLPFTPAARETEADESGDVRTINRKLKTNIYLAIQEQNKNDLWQFPSVDIKESETLLDAAKRAITEQVGTDVEFWCPSNCPWSVHLTPYTDEERQVANLYGIKTFFMKLQHDDGDVSTKDMTVKDFAWLDRQEMADRVKEQQGDHMSKFYYYML
jgi:large subunit ribosomal protein L46